MATICIFFLAGFSATAKAADVTLAWDANTESNLAGYKLYYDGDSDTEQYQGVGANEGDSPVIIYLEDLDDSENPSFTLTGLEDGQYYYFALTAFDTDGLESDFSDEVGCFTGTVSDIAGTSGTSLDSTAKPVADATSDVSSSEGSGGGGCFITMAAADNTGETGAAGPGIFIFLGAAVMLAGPSLTRRAGRRPGRRCPRIQ